MRAFTEPFAFALQPTASRAPFSPSMLRSLTPWTPRGLIESTPRRLLFRAVETRANPFSFHELSRAESHVLLLERSSRFFQLAKRLSKCFCSFLADVADSIHTPFIEISKSSLLNRKTHLFGWEIFRNWIGFKNEMKQVWKVSVVRKLTNKLRNVLTFSFYKSRQFLEIIICKNVSTPGKIYIYAQIKYSWKNLEGEWFTC